MCKDVKEKANKWIISTKKMQIIKKKQIKILELKNKITEIKNSLDGIAVEENIT